MRKSEKFYAALPKRKAELVDGQMYISGSLHKSAMVLAYMVESLGAAAVLELCSQDLLRDAVIEVYGKDDGVIEPMADFGEVASYYPPQKLATDLRLSIFKEDGIFVSGGTTVIKLGEDAFMPDVYVITAAKKEYLTEYYLETAPDLIMEVVHPFMRGFDFGTRLKKYVAAGISEVWMLDHEKRTFEPLVLESGKYVSQDTSNTWYISKSIPELKVEHAKLYDSADKFGVELLDIFELGFPKSDWKKYRFKDGLGWGSVRFAPRLDLNPVAITFPEFISWGGEVKFEMIDGKPLFGGSDQTTMEWLGLLMMTLGMKETVKYLPRETWSKVL